MKLFAFKEFCIWVLPPGQGQVKKFKFSLFKVGLVVLFFGTIVGASLFVAGDYARVQALKAKDQLWLMMVRSERDRLFAENRDLVSDLEALKSSNSSVLAYEKKVKDRLEALSQILKSTTNLALAQKSPRNTEVASTKRGTSVAQIIDESEGMGGPEFDFNPSSWKSDSISDGKEASTPELNGLIERSKLPNSEGDVVSLLDSYLKLINALPLAMPSDGSVSSGFGIRLSPFHLGRKMHEGLDFSAPYGASVQVTADGVVETLARNDTYGLYIDVRHHDQIMTRYAHLSKSLVREGMKVRNGQVIGKVGSSGRSTGPHLHYEVRVDGAARNPESFMKLAEKLSQTL